MRTVGRHLYAGRRSDDFIASCDICGSEWLHSQLTMDPEGFLRCPRDADGYDATSLSEMNAAAMVDAIEDYGEAYVGKRPVFGEEFSTAPLSILGPQSVLGWWELTQGTRFSDIQAFWPNIATRYARGLERDGVGDAHGTKDPGTDDALGVTSAMPESGVFTYQFIQSQAGVLGLAGGNPTVWVVASMAIGESGGAPVCFSDAPPTTAARSFNSYATDNAWLSFAGATDAASGKVGARVKYQTAGELTLRGPTGDTGLHLYMMSAEADRFVFSVDTDEWEDTTPSSDSLGALTCVVIGAAGEPGEGAFTYQPMSGTVKEVVLFDGTPTATQAADMRAYFKRRYPELAL